MAQPEAEERSPRVRKDAKIALIVILALMVLVVVIWGRSPRPDEPLATPRPVTDAAKNSDADSAAPAKSDAVASDADSAREGTPAANADSSGYPGETAMMNHVQPDGRAVIRHDPEAVAEDRTAPGPEAAAGHATPGSATDRAATEVRPEPRPEPKPAVVHTVAKGDTLIHLAVKYYKDQNKWRLIQQANKGVSVLQIGQKLTIPPLPEAAVKAEAPGKPAPAGSATVPGADRAAPGKPSLDRPAKPAPAVPASGKTYTVQKGDTFMKIARSVYRDPAKWRRLYENNRAKLPNPSKPDTLRPGTILDLPALASNNR